MWSCEGAWHIAWAQVYSSVLRHAQAGHAMAGSCCWAVAHSSYPDYDGFTVYLSKAPSEPANCYADSRQEGSSSAPARGIDRELKGENLLHAEPARAEGMMAGQHGQELAIESDTVALIMQHAADMNALCEAAQQACSFM